MLGCGNTRPISLLEPCGAGRSKSTRFEGHGLSDGSGRPASIPSRHTRRGGSCSLCRHIGSNSCATFSAWPSRRAEAQPCGPHRRWPFDRRGGAAATTLQSRPTHPRSAARAPRRHWNSPPRNRPHIGRSPPRRRPARPERRRRRKSRPTSASRPEEAVSLGGIGCHSVKDFPGACSCRRTAQARSISALTARSASGVSTSTSAPRPLTATSTTASG